MNENLKDILSHLQPEVDQQTLLKYLEGKLSSLEQHELEKNTLDSEFEADALEGLRDFENKAKIGAVVEQLNQELKRKTGKKKRWPYQRKANVEPWLLVAILLVLVIAVISYIIIHKMKNP